MDVAIKRVYEAATSDDGYRVLVDRLWPRGITKAAAQLDEWSKDAAPSPALRKHWHADPNGHTPAGYAAFSEAYRAEMKTSPTSDALQHLLEMARTHERLTLVYGARDTEVNHAIVLRDALLALNAAQ